MSDCVFLFPGQGAQAVGMGRELCDACPESKAVFDLADDVLGFGLKQLCFEGPMEELTRTDVLQPALVVTSLAALEAFKTSAAFGELDCKATAGLSLGEYTALVANGTLDAADAISLVHKRGVFMQEASDARPGGMVSIIGLDNDAVGAIVDEAAAGQVLCIANLNCPGQIVISGEHEALERARTLADETTGMIDWAIEECRTVDDPASALLLGDLLLRKGLSDRARAVYRKLTPDEEKRWTVEMRLALCDWVGGRFHEAADALETLIREGDQEPVRYYLAAIKDVLGQS